MIPSNWKFLTVDVYDHSEAPRFINLTLLYLHLRRWRNFTITSFLRGKNLAKIGLKPRSSNPGDYVPTFFKVVNRFQLRFSPLRYQIYQNCHKDWYADEIVKHETNGDYQRLHVERSLLKSVEWMHLKPNRAVYLLLESQTRFYIQKKTRFLIEPCLQELKSLI